MDPFGPTLRRTRRRERPGWRALLALVLSVALNLLVLSRLDASWLGMGKADPRRDVSIAPLSAADWEANRAVQPKATGAAAAALPPAPPAPPPPPAQAPGQVVDLGEQPASQQPPPKETRFVSERNRVVEKETRARVTREPGQKPSPTPVGPVAALDPGQQGTSERSIPGAPGPRGEKAAPAEKAPAPLDPSAPSDGLAAAAAPAEPPPPPGAGGGGEQRKGDPRLAIPTHTLARLAGAASPDHLQGLEEGDGTFLNTREWKYASYFNRIKESVGSAWDPRKALDQRDPDRTIYAFKDRYTLLSVTLDERGSLKDVSVAKTSSVDFLDRTALEAFRKAQPFTNPPAGLVDGSGEIRFTFGFYLEVGSTGMRIYRGASPY